MISGDVAVGAEGTTTTTSEGSLAPPPVEFFSAISSVVDWGKKAFSEQLGFASGNGGKVAISLIGAQVTGDFTLSKVCGSTLKPKKNCNYAVVFAPTAIGPRPGTLTINNNSSSGPRTVKLQGTGE